MGRLDGGGGGIKSKVSLAPKRVAGLYAPANGEISTTSFTVPADEALWINAAAKWKGREVTGGCDEGCQGYIFVAVLDSTTGKELPGFGIKDAVAMKDVDGLRRVLQWKKGKGEGKPTGSTTDSTALAGHDVRLRIYFRDATVYAVGVGN